MTAGPSAPQRVPWWLRLLQPLVVWLLVAFALAVVAIAVLDRLDADGSIGPPAFAGLDAAASPEAYEAVVVAHGRFDAKSTKPPPENYSIWPLRTQMLIDSVVLESAYAGLLLLYMVALRRLARGVTRVGWDWPLQAACLFLAAGVMFDFAENGMTIRAAEDGLRGLLAQATVDDVHQASGLKWAFLGAAMLMTGLFGLDRRLPQVPRSLRIGAWAAIAVAALAAIQGVRLRFDPTVDSLLMLALGIAFAVALVALGRAVWRFRWKLTSDCPDSPSSSGPTA